MKVTKRGKGKYVGALGLQHAYHFYRKETKATRKKKARLEKLPFITVISAFNKFIIDRIVNHGEEYKLPLGMGILRPVKRKPSLTQDGIKIINSKYWLSEEHKDKKLQVFNPTYRLEIQWSKFRARLPGKFKYFFVASKTTLEGMYKAYNRKEVDYSEIIKRK